MASLAALRAQQELLDQMSRRVLVRLQAGALSQADAEDRLALNARLWTRLENEIAGVEAGGQYHEDDVADTVF